MRLNIRQAVASKKLSVIWTISCLMILFIPQIFNVYAYLKNYNIIYTNIMNYIEKVVFYDTKMLQNGLEQIANIGIQISVNNNFKNTAETHGSAVSLSKNVAKDQAGTAHFKQLLKKRAKMR